MTLVYISKTEDDRLGLSTTESAAHYVSPSTSRVVLVAEAAPGEAQDTEIEADLYERFVRPIPVIERLAARHRE